MKHYACSAMDALPLSDEGKLVNDDEPRQQLLV